MTFRKKIEYSAFQFLIFLHEIQQFVALISKSLDNEIEKAEKVIEDLQLDDNQLEQMTKIKSLIDKSYKGYVRSEEIGFDPEESLPIKELHTVFSEYGTRKTRQTFLSEMTLSYIVSALEAFNKDLVYEILLFKQDVLKSSKTITYEKILNFNDKESLVNELANQEIKELGYGSIDDFASYLENKVKVKSSDFPSWDKLRELFYRRNIIMHNKSYTNEIYCKNTGYQKVNDLLITDFEYIRSARDVVREYMFFLVYGTADKFKIKIFDPDEPDNT